MGKSVERRLKRRRSPKLRRKPRQRQPEQLNARGRPKSGSSRPKRRQRQRKRLRKNAVQSVQPKRCRRKLPERSLNAGPKRVRADGPRAGNSRERQRGRAGPSVGPSEGRGGPDERENGVLKGRKLR